MKQHKLYTSISVIVLICFAAAVFIFNRDWYWVPFLMIGGYLMRAVAEFLDERKDKEKVGPWGPPPSYDEKKTNSSETPDSSKKKGKSK